MKLICITGTPGSGKSFMASVAEEMGLKVIAMGEIVREEAFKKYGKMDKDTVGKYAEEIRRLYGEGAVAKLVIDRIRNLKDDYIVIDGVRSPHEVSMFKKYYEIILIGVVASRETRYLRIRSRGRVDDVTSIDDFIQREEREIGFGLDEILHNSDIYFFNDDIDKETAKEYIRRLFKLILDGSI